jgi:hypothetical protein
MNGTKTDVNRWLETFIVQNINRKCFTYGLVDAFYRADNFLPRPLEKGRRSRNLKVNANAMTMP